MNDRGAATPLLDGAGIEALRTAVADYTVDGLDQLLGLEGRAALSRGDLDGARRQCPPGERLATLVRLFVLGCEVPEDQARQALDPLPVDQAVGAGLVVTSARSVRAGLDLRPYEDWWVVSDLGSDVSGVPIAPDHVLGVGAASLSLATATPRQPAQRALDIGTGCGVQALHLTRHCAAVTATDISPRALRFAATTAALNGFSWDLREGSLLDPVAGEQFDVVVANPPFVVSPGRSATDGGYDYRDSGMVGDGVSAALTRAIPGALSPSGVGQLLANWAITADRAWDERVGAWLRDSACDAWVWQREVADPGEYVSMWLRDAGERPATARWTQRYDEWLDWFARERIIAVGMGLITLWRTDSLRPVRVLEDVRQALEQPIGAHLPAWLDRQRWLASAPDADLLEARFRQPPDLVRTRDDVAAESGWRTARHVLRQSHELRWEVEVDDAIAALVAGCQGQVPLRVLIQLLAGSLACPVEDVVDAAIPAIRDLVARGFLLPVYAEDAQ